jgi:hypothetical protein
MPPQMIPVKMGDTTTDTLNPDYIAWMTRDQTLLGYLLSSVTRDVLMGLTMIKTSVAAWSILEEIFAPRTHARSINTRIGLATTKKHTSMMVEYFSKMKTYSQPLGDEEFVAYILMGLVEEFYNPLVSSIVTRVELISRAELYAQMLSYEQQVDKQSRGLLLPFFSKCFIPRTGVVVAPRLMVVLALAADVAVAMVAVPGVANPPLHRVVGSPTPMPIAGLALLLLALIHTVKCASKSATPLACASIGMMRILLLTIAWQAWRRLPPIMLIPTGILTWVLWTISLVILRS